MNKSPRILIPENFIIKNFLLTGFLFFAFLTVRAQPLSNIRKVVFQADRDTVFLDSLSIIPGTFFLAGKFGNEIDSSRFTLLPGKGTLILKKNFFSPDDSLTATYRVFPYSFQKSLFNKDISKVEQNEEGIRNPFLISYEDKSNEIFKFGGLNKSGSISRGLSFGNNQDVVLNSSLNLQMSGQITENVDVLAAITDENIPFQPEGNTQQLQEFDKVFIQLSNKNNKLIAGDYDLKRPDSYFMNFYKRAQGGSFTTTNYFRKDESGKPEGKNKTGVSAAVSKGKYARNVINGGEGNQGPYRLTGANNELYIFVLSGSEKVYINGAQMERGLQNDYIIDYNTAQISFTPGRLITKDSRIVVEFQYSDLNYLRSLIYVNNELELKKWKLKFNFYSEQDSKNQPLQQKLSEEDKTMLFQIGDRLEEAVVPNVFTDTSEFNRDLVHYKKKDTLVSAILYKDIFVYSTSADSGIYNVGFSLVGTGKGNYIPATTSANGRVYEWVAPAGGIPQGSYEPVRLLITPKQLQMATFGAEFAISKNTIIVSETALSNNNQNTFSPYNKYNDAGIAEKILIKNSLPLSGDSAGWKINTEANYEYAENLFTPVERFRPVEFDRDWNLTNEKFSDDENIFGASAALARKKNGFVQYRYKKYNNIGFFNGESNGIGTDFKLKNFRLVSEASYMHSSSTLKKSNFIRHKADFSKAFKYFVTGIREDAEDNRFLEKVTDTLMTGSYSFNEWEIYLQNPDTMVNKFRVFYGRRIDNALKLNSFHTATRAENTGLSFGLLKNPEHRLTANSTYRKLIVADTTLTGLRNDNTLLNNIDHSLSLLKSGLTFTTYYEIGTGQEQKLEFAFLEVPAGQGSHLWKDDNGNGIKEINEFYQTTFASDAKFVKVSVPTNEYVKTKNNQFSEVFGFTPANFFENPEGFRKFISRISNQVLLRRETKTRDTPIEKILNPFAAKKISDSSLVTLSSSIQEIFYFNRSSSRYGFDIGWLDNKVKSFLTSGFENHTLSEKAGNARWNITRVWGINFGYKTGDKSYSSEYFSSRNYDIHYQIAEPRLIIQPSTSFRVILLYEYREKNNTGDSAAHSLQHKGGTEIKYSTLKKGTLTARFNYIYIDFTGSQNSPAAYEMLEGFTNGNNFTWGLSIQRTLSSGLQLSLNYDGRKAQTSNTVHTGGVQLRAYF